MAEKIAEKTEFEKGWEGTEAPEIKREVTAEPVVPEEKPVEVEEVKKDTVADVKVEDIQKAEVSEPDTVKPTEVVEVDDNSATYKQRWKSQEGIVKSEMAKRAEAERRATELETEIEKLRTEQKPVTVPDTISDEIDKLEEQYLDALIEDDKPVAIKIRKQIDDIKFKQFAENTKKATQNEVASTIMQQTNMDKVEKIVKESVAKYPFLDHTNDKTGNLYAIRLVRATRDDYISQGMGFIEALEAAIAEIAPMFNTKAKPVEVAEKPVDEGKVKATVAVETKNTPVKLGGKPKGLETFDQGWDSYKVNK